MLSVKRLGEVYRMIGRIIPTIIFVVPITIADNHTSICKKQFGNHSEFGKILFQLLESTDTVKTFHYSLLSHCLVYVNIDEHLKQQQIAQLQDDLLSGHTLLLDTSNSEEERLMSVTNAISGIGIGFASSVVMIRFNKQGTPEFKQLTIADNDQATNKTVSHRATLNSQKLAKETIQLLRTWKQNANVNEPYRSQPTSVFWRPEISIPVELRQIGMSCQVGQRFESSGDNDTSQWPEPMVDACNANASLSLFYTIDLIRSLPVGKNSEDAKYLRITLDPGSNGGAGWHLVNQPTHKHTWFESWTNRETWFGPIADSYAVSIQTNDPDVQLYHKIPDNQPKHSRTTQTTKVSVGFIARIGLAPSAIDNVISQDEDDEDSEQDNEVVSDVDQRDTSLPPSLVDRDQDHEIMSDTGQIHYSISPYEDDIDQDYERMIDTDQNHSSASQSLDRIPRTQEELFEKHQAILERYPGERLKAEALLMMRPDDPALLRDFDYQFSNLDPEGENSDSQSFSSVFSMSVSEYSIQPDSNSEAPPPYLEPGPSNPTHDVNSDVSNDSLSSDMIHWLVSDSSDDSIYPHLPSLLPENEELTIFGTTNFEFWGNGCLAVYGNLTTAHPQTTYTVIKGENIVHDVSHGAFTGDVLILDNAYYKFNNFGQIQYTGLDNSTQIATPDISQKITEYQITIPERLGETVDKLRSIHPSYSQRETLIKNLHRSIYRQAHIGSPIIYDSRRSITYNNDEYTIRAKTTNRPRVLQTSWLWNREFNTSSKHWRTQTLCPLWCDDWFFSDSAFSPAAYAHFTPGFSATFKVPAEKSDYSTFELSSSIKAVALGGRIKYRGLFQEYAPWGQKGTLKTVGHLITVNWNAPRLNAEIPVSLSTCGEKNHEPLCLTLTGQNSPMRKVLLTPCTTDNRQIWSIDNLNRYHNVQAANYCLTHESDHVISMQSCNNGAAQKWHMQAKTLTNAVGGHLILSQDNQLMTDWNMKQPTTWCITLKPPVLQNILAIKPARSD